MERLVEVVMRNERQGDLLDRVVLAIGILSLCLALAGTLLGPNRHVAAEARPAQALTAV